MKRTALAVVAAAALLSSCQNMPFPTNPFLGTWSWNGDLWTFAEDMSFTGPSSGTYSFTISNGDTYFGAGTRGELVMSPGPGTFDYLVQDYMYVDLLQGDPATSVGLMQLQR
jgi:hypothetical protein